MNSFWFSAGVAKEIHFTPSEPQFYMYTFPEDVDSVLVHATSKDEKCAVMSIQTIEVPQTPQTIKWIWLKLNWISPLYIYTSSGRRFGIFRGEGVCSLISDALIDVLLSAVSSINVFCTLQMAGIILV